MRANKADDLWRLEVPQTLRAPRGKTVGFLAICLAFFAIGIAVFPKGPLVATGLIVFSGIGALVFAASLHPKNTALHVDATGFRFAALFRETYVPWRCIQQFVPVLMPRGVTLVGWVCDPERCAGQGVRMRGQFPGTYGLTTAELYVFLDGLRTMYGNPRSPH